MEIMLNATLAGGVGVGAAADLITEPWAAMLVGFIAGALSSIGFQKIGPFLAENINLQDTCGVNSLHGMPGILGGIVSAVVIAGIADKGFPQEQLAFYAKGLTPSEQAANQIYSLLVTLAISIVSGISGGFISGLSIWQPVHSLYRDDDHFEGVMEKYPAEYLVGGDEVYDEAKGTF
jgi:ammonium transporter Rh